MEENRKGLLVFGGGGIFCLIFLMLVMTPTTLFYWGLLIGVIFGIGTSLYLYQTWDPYLLAPKNPNTKKASWSILWVVPLGGTVATLSADFLDDAVEEVIIGCIFAWVIVSVSYMMIQAWRYR